MLNFKLQWVDGVREEENILTWWQLNHDEKHSLPASFVSLFGFLYLFSISSQYILFIMDFEYSGFFRASIKIYYSNKNAVALH